jgi:anti-anti-sigma factor
MPESRPQYALDVAGAQRLEAELDDMSGDVVVNLEACNFVASSGLRILLKAAQRLSTGGSLTVTNANDTILEVFRISGFASVITIE